MVNLAFVVFFECEITYRRFFMNLFLGYVMQPYGFKINMLFWLIYTFAGT